MSNTADFFRSRLDQMIDLRHPLAVLASRMPWQELAASIAHLFAKAVRAGGARQGTCRSVHAASAVLFGLGRDAVLTTASLSGFKATASIGSQLRACHDSQDF